MRQNANENNRNVDIDKWFNDAEAMLEEGIVEDVRKNMRSDKEYLFHVNTVELWMLRTETPDRKSPVWCFFSKKGRVGEK